MKMKRILALALACIMLAGLLTSCGIGGKTVMKVNGNNISESIFLGAIGQASQVYTQSFGMTMPQILTQDFGDGMTGEDFAKEIASNYIKEFETIRAIAKENNIKLTASDKAVLKEQEKAAVEAQGGRAAYLEELKKNFITEEFAVYLNQTMMLYEGMYTRLFTGDGPFAASVDTMKEKLGEGYVRVKHVLVMANDPDADDYAEKRKKAEEIAAKAKAGDDFDALIEEFGEDPGMQQNPGGYIFDKNGVDIAQSGQMVAEFTAASHALGDNEVSDVVTTSHGFHIIKRLPLNDEYIEQNSKEISAQFAPQAMSEMIIERIETIEVEYTDAYEQIDLYGYFGVEKPDAPLAPEASDDAAEETDASAETDESQEGNTNE